ncbi:hypothetical protein IMY05_C4714000600 [Salix suchowensis]|nr:hypothetical protein IMY05_C4714000600 [Salix suchowensis]
MHTLRYLGALLDQVDEMVDDLQDTLSEMTRTMEEFGVFLFAASSPWTVTNPPITSLVGRMTSDMTSVRILRSQEYKEQLQDINQTFVRLKDDMRMILEARTMISTFDTHEQVQTVSTNINTVIQMLGAIGAKEQKAEEYSKAHGGAGNIIQLDAGPHELIDDPDVKALWQGMPFLLPELHALTNKYAPRQGVDRKLTLALSAARILPTSIRHQEARNRIGPDDAWTLKYLAKVMCTLVSYLLLISPLMCSPQIIQPLGMPLMKMEVDIAHCLKTIRTLINRRKVTDAFKDYLEVLGYLDVVVGSLDDVEDEDGDGLTGLLDAYIEAKDAEIMTFLQETQYRISDTSTLEYIVGQRSGALAWAYIDGAYEHYPGATKGQQLDDDRVGSMCETCASIFVAFYERFEELQRGWKQQKVDVHLFTDSFANGLFTAIHKADADGFSQLTGDVDEYDEVFSDEEEEDEESSEATTAADKVRTLRVLPHDNH